MWQLMYMNNPLGASAGQFKLDMLRHPLPNPLPEFKSLVIALDLAATDRTYSDYSVATALAMDLYKPWNLYILDMIRGKWPIEECLGQIAKFADRVFGEFGRLDRLLFEKQSFQSAWATTLKASRDDIPIELVGLKGDKTSRLSSVATKAQGGHLYINQQMLDFPALCSELIAFPKAQHDDIPDTLSLPFQYWGMTSGGAGMLLIRSENLT
jgi:predicted phage terminase large subunit-like protein